MIDRSFSAEHAFAFVVSFDPVSPKPEVHRGQIILRILEAQAHTFDLHPAAIFAKYRIDASRAQALPGFINHVLIDPLQVTWLAKQHVVSVFYLHEGEPPRNAGSFQLLGR